MFDNSNNDLVDRIEGLRGPNHQPNHKYENSVSKDEKDKHINKQCEALNCYNKATNEIFLRVGSLGHVKLNVCGNCIEKFRSH